MSKIKRFLRTSATYFIGSVLSKLIAFFLLPLYTNNFSPEDFGVYDLVITILSFATPIVFFQIWDGLFRFSFDKQQANEKYSIITNSFSVMILGFIIYSLVFLIIYRIFDFENSWLIYIYGIVIAVQYQYTFIARSFLKNNLFVMSGLISSIINVIINILLIIGYDFGIESLYIAFIFGAITQILIIEVKLHPIRNFSIKKLDIKLQSDMIKFSLPLCIATVSYWMLSGYTKVVISQQLGNYANGLFAVASKFSSMITILITVFQYAWNEMAYLMVEEENRLAKYQKSIQYILKIIVIGSCLFMIIIKIVFPFFIDSSYHEALMVIPLTLVGIAANAFANFVGTIFMAEKKTKWILWTTLAAASINVISLWIFIPIWGLQGAVGALSLSFVIIGFLRILAVRKLFGIKISISNLIFIPLLGIVFYLFYTVENIPLLLLFIMILIAIAVYIFRDVLLSILRSVKKR